VSNDIHLMKQFYQYLTRLLEPGIQQLNNLKLQTSAVRDRIPPPGQTCGKCCIL